MHGFQIFDVCVFVRLNCVSWPGVKGKVNCLALRARCIQWIVYIEFDVHF